MVTRAEAYAMHQLSNAADAINNHIGLLACIEERTDASIKDEVHGSLKRFFSGQVIELKDKMGRIRRDTIEFVGGEDRYKALCLLWITSGISWMQTWQIGVPSDVNGKPLEKIENEAEDTETPQYP